MSTAEEKPPPQAPAKEIEELTRRGHLVLSIDVRGFGETADPPTSVVYSQGDHRVAMWSLHIGQSLLGQRVEDVFAAADYLRNRTQRDAVQIIGIERAGPVVLHAAAFDSRFVSVTLRDSILSWTEELLPNPRDMAGDQSCRASGPAQV